MLRLNAYASSSDDDDAANTRGPPVKKMRLGMTINAAPPVRAAMNEDSLRMIDPYQKELSYNPTYEQLHEPVAGPLQEGRKTMNDVVRHGNANIWTGHVETTGMAVHDFEKQVRNFETNAEAYDPTPGATQVVRSGMGSGKTAAGGTKGAFGKRPSNKDKLTAETLKQTIDEETGMASVWASIDYTVEKAKPTAEESAKWAEWTKDKMSKTEEKDLKTEEKVKIHVDLSQETGESLMCAPRHTGLRLTSDEPPERCFLPKEHVHTWKGHSKGVAAIRFIPTSGHLLLSCGLDAKIKILKVFGKRRCVQTYHGHSKAVRDICFNNDGTKFLSTGYDKQIKLWDTETGKVIGRYGNNKIAYCVKFNPQADKQHLFLAGCSDKKIVCYDTNTSEIIQEYDRHLGPVNSITFTENGTRFASTSDDKSIRVWEWDIPSEAKYIAEPGMYSIAHVAKHPNDKWMVCQAMDNKMTVYGSYGRYGMHKKKVFKGGHESATYAINMDCSPDGSFVATGDAGGRCYIYDWKTCRVYKKFKAHDDVCIDVKWHPKDPSKVATCGWDGLIKYWS